MKQQFMLFLVMDGLSKLSFSVRKRSPDAKDASAVCFGCWTATPGICIIDNFGRELARMTVQSDLMIYLTPITFGGYSSELKKAIDMFACPMLLPFFTRINGEVHHKARYRTLPSIVGIGILPRPEGESEQIFAELVKRNATNFHSPSVQSVVYYRSQPPEQIGEGLKSILRNVGK